MGQISLPVANRTGIYAHWAGSGDNVYNYSKLLKQNLFIINLLALFFKKKFFVYNAMRQRDTLVVYNPSEAYDVKVDENEELTYVDLAKLAVSQIALELPLYAGRVLFLKQRGVLVGLVLFFQPPKGDFIRSKRPLARRKKKNPILGSLLYQNALLESSPLFFSKHTF